MALEPLHGTVNELGYHGTGTITVNRIPERQQLNFKDDKSMRRGDIDQRVSGQTAVVKWKDNKAVLIASNSTSGTAIDVLKRYDKNQKCYFDVDAPKITRSQKILVRLESVGLRPSRTPP
ncbi:hypothetical protein EVAR_10413_1 [Eumeta japonica]|uniref:PiggyBac transposable element-derived protein domain-containing protein n=1 Tax=Eumeta variegata TaxID=151549 RepID=A0A4C1UDI9_EUMVA|nr:hypothetical protein EVAR_10413_1 [Eumeta japonica]